ncbi:separase [Trifolium repens]|nr:separase [Trifolium repens]
MSAESEEDLLSKLQSSNPTGIYNSLTSYLSPILESGADIDSINVISFQTFLHKCFSILGTVLCKPQQYKCGGSTNFNELFKAYELCLSALEVILPKFGDSDKYWLRHKVTFIKCLEKHKRINDVEKHGLNVIERVDKIQVIRENSHCKVLEIYESLFKIPQKSTTTDDQHCERLMDFMKKAITWQRLDCQSCDKLHVKLVNMLRAYAYLLLPKTTFSDMKLGIDLCVTTLIEHTRSPILKEQVYKVAFTMCSHLFKLRKNNHHVINILDCIAPNEVEEGNNGVQFINIVKKCASKCSELQIPIFCETFATYLIKKANIYKKAVTPINSLLRIIAARLTILSKKKTKFEDVLKVLVERHEILLENPPLLTSIIGDQQVEGQSSTQPASMVYLSPSISALYFLCHVIFKSYNCSGLTKILPATRKEKPIFDKMLLTIVDMFQVLCRLILTNISIPSTEKEFDKEMLVNIAAAVFSFSIRTDLKFQDTINMLKDISLSKWIEMDQIKKILGFLNKVEDGKSQKATEIRSISCEILWLFLKSHAEILSQTDLEKLAKETYNRSKSLLNVLYDANYSKMEDKVIEFLKDWSTVKEMVNSLPSPVLVVKTWVKLQCEYNYKKDDNVDSILEKVLSSKKVTKKIIGILLDQEYNAHVEMANERKFTSFCNKMKLKIIASYMQEIVFDTSKEFRQKAQSDRFSKKKIDGVTNCLEDAIKILEAISKDERGSSEVNPINHQLYLAYGLLHLCKPKDNPYLKRKVEDIDGLFESIMIFLYNIFDFIQLKGSVNSTDAYNLVIKMHKLIDASFEKQLTVLWESRRLSHPTCILSLDWVFIKNVLDESKDENNDETCIDSFKNKSGFHQNFYYLFQNSHTDVEDRRKFFQSNSSNDDDIKIIALASHDPIERHSTLIAGYFYLDLCQSHIANGKLMQALLLAKEAHKLHSKLFNSTFEGNFTTWEMIISIVGDVLPSNSSSSEDLDKTYISPWKILQCYLDSTLQVGKIYEMIGDATEAVAYFQSGKEIAYSFKSPSFVGAFASMLGKVYSQQPDQLKSANYEIDVGLKVLKENKNFLCQKCKLIMQATLEEYRGDLCQIKSPEGALKFYEDGLVKLLVSDWKNNTSCPESTCSSGCILSNKGCWHCIQSKVGKTGLLCDLIDLKWEFVRRKMCMKLLSRSGKILARSNQIKVQENVLKRISNLVGLNPFCDTFSSISPKHFRDLVEMWSTNDIFSVDRAEIVNDTCWLFLNGYSEIFSNPSSIELKEIADWLIRAFLRSWDVPIILQEVSKLLTVICQISSKSENYSTLFGNDLNEKSWAFFYHQASIGTHLSCQFILNFKAPNFNGSSYIKDETFMSLRLPETIVDLEEKLTTFLDGLQCTTIMCMSFVDRKYTHILEKFLSRSSAAWMLVSRRSVKAKPIVILLPLQPIVEGSETFQYKKTTKEWVCPWGDDLLVVDDIVPSFRKILQQYFYMVHEILPLKDITLLKDRAAKFDESLHTLLRNIEDQLFGSSKNLLLEKTSDHLILILDYEIQMLPWESMSMLRSQEVYRMPSITSISIVLDKFARHKEQVEGNLGSFPLIDPKCGYFILNPDGSLPGFQNAFQEYLSNKQLKGKTKSEPTVTELVKALKEHDLYLYLGHGSGNRYINDHIVQQLEKCSVAFLMGCSSGSLTLQGSYAPIGTPLSYLMAGSPLIVANLWVMLQSELILLGDSLLKDMLEPSNETDIRRIGAFVAQARDKSIRPFISGAAMVCYGVPVGIKRLETCD